MKTAYRIPHGAAAGIYQAYPRHVGRAKALKVIAQVLYGLARRHQEPSPHEWLLRQTEAYARHRATADPQYTPYPERWFGKGHYDDDPREWGRDMLQGQPSQAEEEFRAMQNRWSDIPFDKRLELTLGLGASAPGQVGSDARLLRQALALWDKEQK